LRNEESCLVASSKSGRFFCLLQSFVFHSPIYTHESGHAGGAVDRRVFQIISGFSFQVKISWWCMIIRRYVIMSTLTMQFLNFCTVRVKFKLMLCWRVLIEQYSVNMHIWVYCKVLFPLGILYVPQNESKVFKDNYIKYENNIQKQTKCSSTFENSSFLY
jgi:hypothetical protein